MAADPIRSCIACRGKAPKAKLLRVVAVAGMVEVDAEQMKPGRGAYLHRTAACLTDKRMLQKLPHALRIEGGLKIGESLEELVRIETTREPVKSAKPKLRF